MDRHTRATSIRLLALAVALATVPACDNGGNDEMMPQAGGPILLHYDGPHDASPLLAGGTTYEAAARFPSSGISSLAGAKLTAVQFYIQSVPDSCRVKIYDAGTAGTPGALLYEQDVTTAVAGASWNTHALTSDVTLSGDDLWISIEFRDTSTQPTIGCDPGPAVPDGNWLYRSSTLTWNPFTVSINWNVRGVVELTN